MLFCLKNFQGKIQNFIHISHFFKEIIKLTNNFRQIDIFIGGLDENLLSNRYFIASRAYYHDSITWCVQEKRAIPRWKNLYRLCHDPIVYLVFVIMTFSCIFFAYFSQQFEDKNPMMDWHQVFCVAFRGMCYMPTEFYPKFIPTRIFYSFCLFGSLIFTVSTLAFFIKALNSVMYADQIKSIQEIIDNSFKLYGDSFAFHHLINQNQVNYNKKNSCFFSFSLKI